MAVFFSCFVMVQTYISLEIMTLVISIVSFYILIIMLNVDDVGEYQFLYACLLFFFKFEHV